MSYSKDTFEKADKEMKKRRADALLAQQKRHDDAVKKIPEILELEKTMSSAGLATIKGIGMGADAESYIKQLAAINLKAQTDRIALLKQHNLPEDYLDVHYTCKKCEDKGCVNGFVCDCYQLLLRSIEYEKLCSTLPIGDCRFENFRLDYYPDGAGVSSRKRMKNVYDYCKAYADDFDKSAPSLLFYGMTGLGKTHLSLAIAGKAVEKGYGVIYTSAQNLFNRLEREKFGRSEDNNTAQTILDCDLLIIDDLGAEFSTQFTISALYNIVNSRGIEGRPTIISTNLSPEMIEATYTDRIASRILHGYEILRFDGADIRQLKTESQF